MNRSSNPFESPQASPNRQAELEKRWHKWRRTRERGRRRFLWVNGVLGWGLFTGVCWSLWMAYSQGWDHWPYYFVGGITLFPIGGYVWGSIMWRLMEKQYEKETGANEDV